jgi:hypothetical protein
MRIAFTAALFAGLVMASSPLAQPVYPGPATGSDTSDTETETETRPAPRPQARPQGRANNRTAAPAAAPGPTVTELLDACGADIQQLCQAEPFRGGGLVRCLNRNQASLAAECRSRFAAVRQGAPAGANPGRNPGGNRPTGSLPADRPPNAAANNPQAGVVRARVQQACQGQVRQICPVQPGEGRIMRCIQENREKFTPECLSAMAQARRRPQAN